MSEKVSHGRTSGKGFAFITHLGLVCETETGNPLFHGSIWGTPHSNDKLSKKQLICSSTAFYTALPICWGRWLLKTLFLTLSCFQVHYLLGDTPNEILRKNVLCQCLSSESSCFFCSAHHPKFSQSFLASVRPLVSLFFTKNAWASHVIAQACLLHYALAPENSPSD